MMENFNDEQHILPKSLHPNAVVISGISGRLPLSKNVDEFKENLFNKVNMISLNERMNLNGPKYCGLISELNRFDAGFFGVHYKQACKSDPLNRMIIEKAVEAIFDAGLHPSDLQGSNVGVYVANFFAEAETYWTNSNDISSESLSWTGMGRFSQPNQVSYALKLKGPSMVVDSACASFQHGIELAFRSINEGEVEAAIVTGGNLCLDQHIIVDFMNLGALSFDNKSKVFDKNADGFIRAETIGCMILQKARNANRIYARVLNAITTSDGYKEGGISYPSVKEQETMLRKLYVESNVKPDDLSFYEAHGTGTKVGDPIECTAIDNVIAKARKKPLLIGSVKSNMGHVECVSGFAGILKSIIAFESGYFPPNINFTEPQDEMVGIMEGRMKIVTEKVPFENDDGLIGVNNFGFGGSNSHVLIKRNSNYQNNNITIDVLPLLACVSGRTEDAVMELIDGVQKSNYDFEYIALLNNIFRKDVPTHSYRGFIIKDRSGEVITKIKRNISTLTCLVFGEFKNWFGIAQELLVLEKFSKSLNKQYDFMKQQGVDFDDKDTLGKNSIIGGVMVHMSILDLMENTNIVNHAGYFYGALISAYLNKILTFEQVMKSAILLQDVFNELNSISNIEQKSFEGTFENKLITLLLTVENSNIQMDKAEIVKIAKKLTNYMLAPFNKNVIMSDVVFQIGSISNETGHNEFEKITYFNCDKENYLLNTFKLLGDLFLYGINTNLNKIYATKYPVSRGTKTVSSHVKWNHKIDWMVPNNYQKTLRFKLIRVNTNYPQWSFIKGHMVDGRIIFPATGYLYMVWEFFSELNFTNFIETAVSLEDCRFISPVTLTPEFDTIFLINILHDGTFEIVANGTLAATGRISLAEDKYDEDKEPDMQLVMENLDLNMERNAIYKELKLRGYDYRNDFMLQERFNIEKTYSLIKWNDNWVSFCDNCLQLPIIYQQTTDLGVQYKINKATINPKKHLNLVNYYKKKHDDHEVLIPVFYNPTTNEINSRHISMKGLQTIAIGRKQVVEEPVLEKYEFIPNTTELSLKDSIRVNLEIILENLTKSKMKIIEILEDNNKTILAPLIKSSLDKETHVDLTLKLFSTVYNINSEFLIENNQIQNETNCTLIIGSNLLQTNNELSTMLNSLDNDEGYIISREPTGYAPINVSQQLSVVTAHSTPSEKLILLKKKCDRQSKVAIKISNDYKDFEWFIKLQDAIKNNQQDVLLYAEGEINGIMGFAKSLKREPYTDHVKCLFIMDENIKFDMGNDVFKEQLNKNLYFNVLKGGKWGTYRHLLLEEEYFKKSEHCYLTQSIAGHLSTLEWVEGPLKNDCVVPENDSLINVHYSGINFKDVLIATGKIVSNVTKIKGIKYYSPMGLEYSGKDKYGNNVMGMCCSAISTLILAKKSNIYPVPKEMTLEEAATLPVVYSTVIYGLIMRGKLKRGESILIHSGTGGVGQAAIRIALHYNCEVYVTVGTKEKRDFLKKLFPQIKEANIGCSRDLSFEQAVLKQTNGRGVDVVLNSLADEKLISSVRCLAENGRFIEIGKFNLIHDSNLSLLLFKKQASYHGIMVDEMMLGNDPIKQNILNKLFLQLLNDSVIQPLNRTVFVQKAIHKAFKYMMDGNHTGKVVLRIKPDLDQIHFSCNPRYLCKSNEVCIIIGGLGGIGLELIDWLAKRSCKNFVISSSRGISNGYQKYKIHHWLRKGLKVHVSTLDVTTEEGCEQLLCISNKLGLTVAIFNLAGILRDAIFENQTVENFQISLKPKVNATFYLDKLSRKLCPSLRTFVVFSSFTSGRGNPGQTNYGMANSFMERICEKRKSEGYPSLAIQWGAISDVGMVGDSEYDYKVTDLHRQNISNCLNLLDTFLTQTNFTILCSMVVAKENQNNYNCKSLSDTILDIIGMANNNKNIGENTSLSEIGMDSLSTTQVKQVLEREYGLFFSANEIRQLTITKLNLLEDKRVSSARTSVVKKNPMKEEIENFYKIRMKLPSKVEESTDEAPNVIFFPGIDGSYFGMQDLASQLNAHVTCLLYPKQFCGNFFKDMAKELIPEILKVLGESKKFWFVAHSFGYRVALEAVHIMENQGYSGSLISIDASEKLLEALVNKKMTQHNNNIQETNVFEKLSAIFSHEEIFTLRDDLKKCNTWDDYLNLYISRLNETSEEKIKYHKADLTAMLHRLKLLHQHKRLGIQIKNPIWLIRAREDEYIPLEESYDISKDSYYPVQEDIIDGNHGTILNNPQLAIRVNDWLKK